MPKLIDLVGQKFNNLTVVAKSSANRRGNILWLCECICGVKKTFSGDHLTRKKSPVRSCGCLAHKQGSKNNLWKGYGDIFGNWWYSHVLRERTQTKRVKIQVEITIEYAWNLFIKQNKKCALSGQYLTIGTNRYNTASIDRIDSSKGYIEWNVQWVHKDVNFMKRTYSQEYFIEVCSLIAKYKTKNNLQ